MFPPASIHMFGPYCSPKAVLTAAARHHRRATRPLCGCPRQPSAGCSDPSARCRAVRRDLMHVQLCRRRRCGTICDHHISTHAKHRGVTLTHYSQAQQECSIVPVQNSIGAPTCCSCRTRTGARELKCDGGGGSSPFHTTSTSATAGQKDCIKQKVGCVMETHLPKKSRKHGETQRA